MACANDFPSVLPQVLTAFLSQHDDANAVAVSEPGYEPVKVNHPSFGDRWTLSELTGVGRLAVMSCLRRARNDGTAHHRVTIQGSSLHLSAVALIGTPYTILVAHPSAGIGPESNMSVASNASVLGGQLDADFIIKKLEAHSCSCDGCDAGNLTGQEFTSIVDAGSFGTVIDSLLEAQAFGASSCDVTLRLPGHDAVHRLTVMWVLGTLRFSIVERSSIERATDNSVRRAEMDQFAGSVHHGFFRVSANGALLYKNARLDELFGRTFQTLADFGSIRTIGGSRLIDIAVDEIQSTGECIIDVQVEVDGQQRMLRLRIHGSMGLDDHFEYAGSAEDVTEILARQKQLEQEALTDPLTGLANRRGLESVTDTRLQSVPFTPFALFLCDLDGFKQVNDSLGHDAGDKVIIEVGKRLLAASRDDDLVARLGGDEFVVVANNVADYDEAMEFAERLLPWLRQPYNIDDTQLELSGSVGVAFATEAMATHTLLQMADHAMYEAKRAGRNQAVSYHTPDATTTISPLALRRDLRRAITDDTLDLAFQPIYAIDQLDTAVSAEVLLRWDHPIQGQIDPSAMVAIAEQSGLIRELGEWILTESIRSAASVNADADRQISIAVNVSALQVGRPGFVEMVAELLAAHGLAPSSLTIELTESYLIDGMDHAREAIDSLTDLGVRLAIDDFGTGFSTFDYLLTLPVYAVKIDPSFTRRLTETRGAAMLRGLSMACRELDMLVIAEGIETVEQLEAARVAGVTHAQGYLLGMPVSTASLGMRANSAAPRVA